MVLLLNNHLTQCEDLIPPCSLKYVLITPARNEIANIEKTINSVIEQTIRPMRWVIISDGSSDGTDQLVSDYVAKHEWIELVRMPERGDRNFSRKVEAFNAGYDRLKTSSFDLIGNLDADLSFDNHFFEFLLGKFKENPELGIGGAPFWENGKTYDFKFASVEHVSGACQLFRRQCFEDIGGYMPIEEGGIDVIAVLSARMHGWQTRTFLEKQYTHHRKMGTAKHSKMRVLYKDGQKDYSLGAHPGWIVFRSIYQMKNQPLFMGGFLLLAGYVVSMINRRKRPISKEMIQFRRKDQMRRLRLIVRKLPI